MDRLITGTRTSSSDILSLFTSWSVIKRFTFGLPFLYEFILVTVLRPWVWHLLLWVCPLPR